MTRTAALLLVGLALPLADRAAAVSNPGGSPAQDDPETVDFGQAPAAAVSFRLRESGIYRVTGSLDFRESWRRTLTLDVKQRLDLVQRIAPAEGAGERRILRTYEEYGLETRQVTRDPDDPEAEPRAVTTRRRHPLAGRTVRATLAATGGGSPCAVRHLEERDGAGWQPAGPDVARRLTAAMLLQPVIPLPAGARRVGDRWTTRDRELAPYFCDAYSGEEPTPEIEGALETVFAGFLDHPTGRCAVLALDFDVTVRYPRLAPHRMRMKGTCLYHLTHRIVVALQAAGSMVARGDLRQGEHHGRMDLSGTIRSQSEVEILPPAPPDPDPEPSRR